MLDAKLVRKQSAEQQTSVIKISEKVSVGSNKLLIIGGPCAVENQEQMDAVAQRLNQTVQMIRGGVYKPRTSPYSFQGLGEEGIRILQKIKDDYGIPVITEVMSQDQISILVKTADILQIGSRNMQNFDLLKALGQAGKPVLLKRGLCASIEEFVLAAEYIVSHGNPDVILCERGIRSFDNYTRNVLDLGAVVALKQITHLPVIVDPSHACGKSELVAGLSRAAIASGADGLIIECHPEPSKSVSDARQALSLDEMESLVRSLKPLAAALGRSMQEKYGAKNNSQIIAIHPNRIQHSCVSRG